MTDPDDLWSDGYVMMPRRWFPKAGHRGPGSIDSDKAAREPEARVDLLALANHDYRNGLEPGCCDPSLQFLADRWNWDRSRVVRFLRRLERENVIAREKPLGRRNAVTRFLAYDPPKKADTSATHPRSRDRYRESPAPNGFRGSSRHSPSRPTDTAPGPNRTKRIARARKEEGYKKKACPSCWHVEIDAAEEACGGCLGLPSLDDEITRWRPEDGGLP